LLQQEEALQQRVHQQRGQEAWEPQQEVELLRGEQQEAYLDHKQQHQQREQVQV